jgi:hypothetical protein
MVSSRQVRNRAAPQQRPTLNIARASASRKASMEVIGNAFVRKDPLPEQSRREARVPPGALNGLRKDE